MSERYRADQVGSLLRPFELIQARAAFSNGQISLDQLRKIEDHAILYALQLQRETGWRCSRMASTDAVCS